MPGLGLGVIVDGIVATIGVRVVPPHAANCIASAKMTNKSGVRFETFMAYPRSSWKAVLFLEYNNDMPIIRVPNVISYYTDKQTQFEVSGSTALEAVQNAVEKYPQLKFHVFDKDGNLRRHMYLFVNDVNVHELDGNETKVGEKDIVRILAAAAGG